MSWFELMLYPFVALVSVIVYEIYWTSVRSDDDAADHFARDAGGSHLRVYLGWLKVLGIVLLALGVILALSSCTAVNKVVEAGNKPVLGAEDVSPTPTGVEFDVSGCEVIGDGGRQLDIADSLDKGWCVYGLPPVDPAKEESPVQAVQEPVVTKPDVDLGARLCDSDIADNMDNPNKLPTTVVEPGYGIVVSMDPGQVTGNGKKIIASKSGILLGFVNDATEPVTVTVKTGWNQPNGQWNVYLCRFDAVAVADQAAIKQAGEKKPMYEVIAWGDIKDTAPAEIAETSESPTKAHGAEAEEVGSIRLSGHYPVGNVVKVTAGERFWLSSDPGEVCVGTVCSTQTSGYTLLLSGPADILVKSPAAEVTNYVVGNAPDFNWNGTDRKGINLTFRDGKFANR